MVLEERSLPLVPVCYISNFVGIIGRPLSCSRTVVRSSDLFVCLVITSPYLIYVVDCEPKVRFLIVVPDTECGTAA